VDAKEEESAENVWPRKYQSIQNMKAGRLQNNELLQDCIPGKARLWII
jgi:hypothetical protein